MFAFDTIVGVMETQLLLHWTPFLFTNWESSPTLLSSPTWFLLGSFSSVGTARGCINHASRIYFTKWLQQVFLWTPALSRWRRLSHFWDGRHKSEVNGWEDSFARHVAWCWYFSGIENVKMFWIPQKVNNKIKCGLRVVMHNAGRERGSERRSEGERTQSWPLTNRFHP